MRQTWDKLLFLHWPMPAEQLRWHVPAPLEIDTYEGTAWVAVTPLVVRGLRPPFLPPAPLVSRTLEINVRTYVHLDGVPGVWFFSLDASNPLAVWGARLGFSLPYFRATMEMSEQEDTIDFTSRRTHAGAAPAEFSASWMRGQRLPEAQPGTRDFFLIERYCLYTISSGRIYRCRIHHRPWTLRTASLSHLQTTMVQATGLAPPAGQPLLHAQADSLAVDVWRPERLR